MRSDINQTDVFRDSPATKAAQWRAAAETCAQQFPGDARRLRYYQERAELYEAQCVRRAA
ncbi:hypothetical protein GGR65_003369 [Xanthomonas sp. 3376]|nr:hypothetical protein [Xanthomonas arboricola]